MEASHARDRAPGLLVNRSEGKHAKTVQQEIRLILLNVHSYVSS